MPSPFLFEHPTRIAFGEGRSEHLAGDVRTLGGSRARVIVITDQGVAAAGLLDRVLRVLSVRRRGLSVHAALAGEPGVSDVDEALLLARQTAAEVVVALGGGSALDLGKLVGALTRAERSAEAYALAARALPDVSLPLICIPTTAGTGAEVTRTAVFTDREGRKVWAWGKALLPRIAVLDPALSAQLPAAQSVLSGLDALVHAIEAATNRRSHALSDAPALHAIRLIATYLPRLLADPANPGVRAHLLLAACLAGLAIDQAGTAVAHALGHGLGTIAGVPHALAVALAMRATLAWNAEAAPRRHRPVGEALALPAVKDDQLADALERRYVDLLDALGLDLDLGRYELGPHRLEDLIEATLAPPNRPMLEANPRPVTREGLTLVARRLLEAGA